MPSPHTKKPLELATTLVKMNLHKKIWKGYGIVWTPPFLPPFHKKQRGQWNFSKMVVMGKIGSQEWQALYWDGKVLKSLYIVSRGVLTLLFYEYHIYCLSPLFQILSTSSSPTSPLPHFPITHNLPPPSLFFLFSCFFGWMGDHTIFDVLLSLIKIWIYTCQAFVP